MAVYVAFVALTSFVASLASLSNEYNSHGAGFGLPGLGRSGDKLQGEKTKTEFQLDCPHSQL